MNRAYPTIGATADSIVSDLEQQIKVAQAASGVLQVQNSTGTPLVKNTTGGFPVAVIHGLQQQLSAAIAAHDTVKAKQITDTLNAHGWPLNNVPGLPVQVGPTPTVPVTPLPAGTPLPVPTPGVPPAAGGGAVKAGTTAGGANGAPVTATPSTSSTTKDLLTFAVMTSPAWLVLLLTRR